LRDDLLATAFDGAAAIQVTVCPILVVAPLRGTVFEVSGRLLCLQAEVGTGLPRGSHSAFLQIGFGAFQPTFPGHRLVKGGVRHPCETISSVVPIHNLHRLLSATAKADAV
jgi:hypothetical protein